MFEAGLKKNLANKMSEDKIKFRDMDENQKREYKKEKERERRSKMFVEKKEKEKKNAKLGMQKLRSELSDRWLEYENITDKHRKRAERLNRDDVKHSKDYLKA